MKIRISLKDPDSMHDAVDRAVHRDVEAEHPTLSKKERDYIADDRAAEIQGEIAERWMPYSEYLHFEVDTDTWTATILPAKDFR